MEIPCSTHPDIDADYRGEVQVLLVNLGAEAFHRDARHADSSLCVAPVAHARLVETAHLDETTRGPAASAPPDSLRDARGDWQESDQL